jgi:hypothetical protein
MARKEPAKGIHTSPAKAGKKNMPEDYALKNHDPENTVQRLLPMLDKGMAHLKQYKGLWTDDDLALAVRDFFNYCGEHFIKPCKSGLELWLGVSRPQYIAWADHPEKYGAKSEIIQLANTMMETSYINRVEAFPTGNIFLLKTSHGHVETSRIDVVAGARPQNPEEVKDLVSKLGLDKPQ